MYRLSVSGYKDKFILKGGALLYAHDGFQARPTLDIDFMAKNVSNDVANTKKIFQEICQIECKEDGVVFDVDTIETSEIAVSKDYHGVRLSLLAHLDTAQQNISMDIGFGDVITPSPQQLAFPALIATVPGANILVYSLETVVAEKFQAMISLSLGNSRMKDFFTDSNRTQYWKGFLKRIKYSTPLSFTDVGTLLRTHLQPYWEQLCPKNIK